MKNPFIKKDSESLLFAITTLFVLYFLICMIVQPSKYISVALNGISAWAFNVLPSILPFMFFTRILSSFNFLTNLTSHLSFISKTFFKTPPISIYTFTMSILSGYPVGSKMVADLYLQGKISKEDAFKMTSFCSTSGPMFIIGAVGIGMFKNSHIGYILFISHVIGAFLNGCLFRNFKLKKLDFSQPQQLQKTKNDFDLSEIVLNSTISILSVGCIITIFFIIIECLSPILNIFPQNVTCLLEGLIEITKGCLDISTLNNKFLSTSLCSFVIGFGGFSTILQSFTMLNNLKMPVKLFVLQKFCHACFSLLICLGLLLIWGI